MLVTAVLLARLPDKRLTFRRGASDRNRTNDTGIFSPLLYRLSYRGITGAFVPAPSRTLMNRGPRKDLRSRGLWGRGGISAFAAAVLRAGLPDKPPTFRRATRIGLEPTTPSVTGWCSNQLSYRAILEQRLLLHYGAADEARTRYLHLGKVALYQMSYGRILETLLGLLTGASDRNRTNDTGIFSPLLYRLSYRGAPDDDYYT